jgi:hypothetical protein
MTDKEYFEALPAYGRMLAEEQARAYLTLAQTEQDYPTKDVARHLALLAGIRQPKEHQEKPA